MGDRVTVVFHNGKECSPEVYLHWGGQQYRGFLAETWKYMEGRRGDPTGMCAHFIGIAHADLDGHNHSLYVSNLPATLPPGAPDDSWRERDPGDAGFVLVNAATGLCRRFKQGDSAVEEWTL